MITSAAKQRRRAQTLILQTVVLAVIVLAGVHGPVAGYGMYANVDEAYAAALSSRLLDGFHLYEGAVSQRGPAMYYFFALIGKLHGWDSIVAIRIWAFLFTIFHLALMVWVGLLLVRTRAVLFAVCLTSYALVFGVPAADAIALHGETLQLPFLLASVGLGALAIRDRKHRARWLILSGLGCGIAITIKQSVVLHALPLLIWLWVDALRNRTLRAKFVRELCYFIIPLGIPSALAIANAVREGTLKSLYYYCVVYNRDVHMHPTTRVFPLLANVFLRLLDCPGFFVVGSFMAAGLVFAIRGRAQKVSEQGLSAVRRGFGPMQYLVIHTFVSIASACSMYRFFPHYFLPCIPFVSLTFAVMLESQTTQLFKMTYVRGFQGLLCFLGFMSAIMGERADGRITHDRTHDTLGKYIAATTAADERIFVWGFSPTLYGYSKRRPASRFVFSTYVTGLVPWFWEKLTIERARIVPGSVEALIADLEREKPVIVVDAGSIMMARPMRAYREPGAWLEQNYCFEMRLGGFDLYRRKQDTASACVDTRMPEPYDAIDWNGRPLGLPVARTIGVSFPLPKRNYLKPIWFRDGPRPRPEGLVALIESRILKEEAEAADDGFRVEEAND